eukprot:GHVN01062971.1.p1 GENE.GHVN01062971.1~~GHVN01062971.1.p1  ORF type:complete len:104 (+),score=3.05 GHVN01062971.1:124-435(+)
MRQHFSPLIKRVREHQGWFQPVGHHPCDGGPTIPASDVHLGAEYKQQTDEPVVGLHVSEVLQFNADFGGILAITSGNVLARNIADAASLLATGMSSGATLFRR